MKFSNLVLITAALLVSISNAHALSGAKKYYLKGDPVIGSRIQNIDATSPVPFNKRYQELSEQHQDLVRSKFNNLGLNDIPPFPQKGLKAVYEPIIKANKKFGDSSAVKVTATITRNGVVDEVKVLSNNSEKFKDYVEKALARTKFEPASCNGVACEMKFPIEIQFN